MKKPIVTVDNDDVSFLFMPAFLAHVNEREGTNKSLHDIVDYDRQCEAFGVSDERLTDHYESFYQTHAFRALQPVPDAYNVLSHLRLKYRFFINSQRPSHIHDITRTQLEEHFPDIHAGVRFVDRLTGPTKADICLTLGAQIHIDDVPRHADACVDKGIHVLLFDQPWNQGYKRSGVTRVYSWEDISNILKQ